MSLVRAVYHDLLGASLSAVIRGVTTGVKEHNSPGAESLRGCGKVPTMSQVLQCSTFASEKPQVRTWGRQTCFLPRAPSNLVTPLSIWRLVPSRNLSTHLYAAKLRCRQTADSRTALAIALKLVFRFHLRFVKS